jgi:hypothetical protein
MTMALFRFGGSWRNVRKRRSLLRLTVLCGRRYTRDMKKANGNSRFHLVSVSPMTMLRFILCFAFSAILCGCHHSVTMQQFNRETTNGVRYRCVLLEIDSSNAPPAVFLARSGALGNVRSVAAYEVREGRLYVEGLSQDVTEPTIFYKEAGNLRKKLITNSGIWSPLFRNDGPTTDEIDLIFEHLDRDRG